MIRGVAAVGGLALVAALAGCNGGSDGSDTATTGSTGSTGSTAAFCGAFNDLFDQVLGADASDSAATVRAFKGWAGDMEQVDVPSDMPDDARHGFELFVEQAKGIDENASLDDLAKLGEGLSDADRKDGQAFNDWTTDNCPLDLPSPSAS